MRYISTRGDGAEELTFEEAVLRGLAPDGGLYIPTELPTLPADWQSSWSKLSFVELAYEILSLFIPGTEQEGGIPSSDLRDLVQRSFASFKAPNGLVTPIERLGEKEWCLELWHGPTFAFKDVALQTLGNLFEYFLARRNAKRTQKGEPRDFLTVLGATSGDTGSAAIAGLRSKSDISIFILHPKGRVSPIQEAQMTTVLDSNVHNLALEGTFDDCQDVVKLLFSDPEFNKKHHLAAINSINFARILAQIVYYFSAYFQLRTAGVGGQGEDVEFVVPTGNFGDVLAGYFAKRLGLPISKLVVATNENDILQRFWATGRYEKQASSGGSASAAGQTGPAAGSSDGSQGGVKATLSPAMDILVSSNFERLLWYIAYETSGRSRKAAGAQLQTWMKQLKEQGKLEVSPEQLALARKDFDAERVSDGQTKETILRYFTRKSNEHHSRGSYLIDPHTAVGFEAANRRSASPSSNKAHQVVLSTAHPAKFAEAVTSSLESANVAFDFEKDVLPKEMHGLLQKERRVKEVKRQGGNDAVSDLGNGTRQVLDSLFDSAKDSSATQANGASV